MYKCVVVFVFLCDVHVLEGNDMNTVVMTAVLEL